MMQTALYSVSNTAHFPGVVALLNSLRMVGHEEPLIIIDAGLTAEQRARLAPHARVIAAPRGTPVMFLAPYGPTLQPAEIAVVLDADTIVVRALTELIGEAERGRFVTVLNTPPNHDRFFPEWRAALSLGELRRMPYINAGQMIIPAGIGARIYGPWTRGQTTIGTETTRYGRAKLNEPFYFADQDVLNAVLAAELDPGEIVILDHRFAPHPPFPGLELVDETRLACRYRDGESPFILHHIMAKPWLSATPTNIYSRLLSRLLLEPDVRLRMAPAELPLRLRKGALAGADRRRAHAQAVVRMQARRQLGRFGIRTRLAARRRRRHAGGT
jgi:hypothetical protein